VHLFCNYLDDVSHMVSEEEDSTTNPSTYGSALTSAEITRLNSVNIHRDSPCLGYDIFVEAMVITMQQ